MGYSRRRKKGRAATKAKIKYKPPTARTQQAQILDINNKVNLHTKMLRGLRYKITHSTRLSMNITGTALAPYSAIFCNNLSDMNLQFTDPSEATGGKYNYDRQGRFFLTYTITSNTEPTPMPLSVFLVSPINTKVALSVGMTVSGVNFNLAPGVDYVNSQGITHMNKKRFIIHKHWTLNLLPILALSSGVPAQWQGDLKPLTRKHGMRNRIVINNRKGTWNDAAAGSSNWSVTPSQRVVLIVFNNNISQPATFPILTGQVIHTAWTSE